MKTIKLTTAAFLLSVVAAGCGNPSLAPAETEDTDEEWGVRLEQATLAEFGIEVAVADSGWVEEVVAVPGEVVLNRDRMAHVVPRVSGVVKSVSKSVGDRVDAGTVLAEIDSRELSDIKADYLASLERADLAEATFEREDRLFEQGITSEQEYLEARQALAEAAIAMRSARQKLLALGFSETAITNLPSQGEHDLVHFQLTSPIAGVVIERNVSQGESLSADWDAIVIANLSTVWVDLNVFQRDLERVREGQLVRFATTGDMLRGQGRIDFVRPIVGEDTRTAIARIVYENGSGDWKPGLFVDADIIVSTQAVAVLVPPSALTQLDGQTVVFVETERGFVPSQVVTGLEGVGGVEIVDGLAPGERFVSSGAFTVKAELEKGSQEGGHQH